MGVFVEVTPLFFFFFLFSCFLFWTVMCVYCEITFAQVRAAVVEVSLERGDWGASNGVKIVGIGWVLAEI
jgi:hypothetical protein